MTTHRWIAWISLGLAAALAPALAPAADPTLKKIVVLTDEVFQGRHSPYFVGVEKGFYKDVGLDVQISPGTGSGPVLTALERGTADYGMAEAASVVQAVAKGAKVKAFGVFMDAGTSGLASLKRYATPESISGKSVAASLTDSARVILPILFEQKNLDPASVKWQAADRGASASLLLKGTVDLVTASLDGDVPALVRLARPQLKVVHFVSFADWGYDVFGFFLVARADHIASQSDEVKAFATATAKAVKYAIDHQEEAATIMVKHHRTLDQVMTLAQWRQASRAIDTPYVAKNGYGVATPERLQRTIDLLKQASKLDVSLSPRDIYVSGLITP
jgi:NitT/TauT family transport system substrate-binding protein